MLIVSQDNLDEIVYHTLTGLRRPHNHPPRRGRENLNWSGSKVSNWRLVIVNFFTAGHQLFGLKLLLAFQVVRQLVVLGHDCKLSRGQPGVVFYQQASAGRDQHAANGPKKANIILEAT